MNWERLKTMNGWVSDRDDPLSVAVIDNELIIAGVAYPTEPSSAGMAVARLPHALRPFQTVYGEEEEEYMVAQWRVEPNGRVYYARRHLLELM